MRTKITQYFNLGVAKNAMLCSLFALYANSVRSQASINDYDGNVYQTVAIGNQLWTTSNLKVTRYNDGTLITTGLSNADWALTTNGSAALNGAYSIYPFADAGEANEATVIAKYGFLYNAYAILNAKGIAPAGWRVATDDDWKVFEMHAGMSQTDADLATNGRGGSTIVAKLIGEADEWGLNKGTDDYNFLMMPAGYRAATGAYGQVKTRAYFWTSSTSTKTSPSPYNNWRRVTLPGTGMNRVDISRNEGYSIRLIRISPLPVELLNYKLKRSAKAVTLSWETVSEQNNDYFVVERSSDGKNFKEVTKISGKGTTNERQNYSFTDYSPASGVNYYRLKQYDKDATVSDYGIRAVNFGFEDVKTIAAHPNPVSGNNITISFTGYKGGVLNISLINSLGIPVYRESASIAEGQVNYVLNLNKKPAAGQYILNIQGDGFEKSLKLIVQ